MGKVTLLESAPADVRTIGVSSGRKIVLKSGDEDEIEVRSPSGEMEVSIRLTSAGPEVRVIGGSLTMESPGPVAVDCKRYFVHASEGMALYSEGDISLDGRNVLLNCAEAWEAGHEGD